MCVHEEAQHLFLLWTGGSRDAVIARLKEENSLMACAICAQFVLLLMDDSDDLPAFVEMIENAAFDRRD